LWVPQVCGCTRFVVGCTLQVGYTDSQGRPVSAKKRRRRNLPAGQEHLYEEDSQGRTRCARPPPRRQPLPRHPAAGAAAAAACAAGAAAPQPLLTRPRAALLLGV
jgi:hypothetical protein